MAPGSEVAQGQADLRRAAPLLVVLVLQDLDEPPVELEGGAFPQIARL
jgi:hypothetical protein